MAATTGFSRRSTYSITRTSNSYYMEHGSNHSTTVVQSVGVIADHYPHHQIIWNRPNFHHSQPPKGDQIIQRTTTKTTTPKSEAYVDQPMKDAGKLEHQKYKKSNNVITHKEAAAIYGGKLVEISNVINHKEAAAKYKGKLVEF